MKKLLVVGVIILFIGLAFAPSINANISKESEMVDFSTEICGLNGGKHTVQLTKAEAEEVEHLIDDIERRLDEVETREEAVKIFNEAIVELDKYGLLGGLSVKQAQRLVTGKYNNFGENKIIKQFLEKILPFDENHNYLCLTAGLSQWSVFVGFPFSIVYYLFYKSFGLSLEELIGIFPCFGIIIECILFPILVVRQFIPWNIMNTFILTEDGFLFTFGLNGIKTWDTTWEDKVMGAGFSGIKIIIPRSNPYIPAWEHFFIGFTLIVEDFNWP